ncbi:unnamed protein product [Bursaphelenchus okinawaensis]|uniref:Uncharacterized protein n=1 Tax=Bursaphelenchus okinawaensis TaxID=465554 RepID=A0A811LDZ0_9BILA|nr:unnamed protein product [Bursaphelenchus okinawaensis]CAG9121241.1 unnamed protein product [Bursaphelenchus okinawaensis]
MSIKPGKLEIVLEDSTKKVRIGRVKKIAPPKAVNPHHIYVNHHTKLMSTFKKAEKLLNTKLDYVILHATSVSIPYAIRVANLLKESMKGSVTADIRTGTVKVTDRDETEPTEPKDTNRSISLVSIRIARVL